MVGFLNEPICSWNFVCREFSHHRFYFTSSDHSVQIIFLLYSVFVGCMFLETCPFLLGCPVCWYIIVHSIFLWFLDFWGISCYVSHVIYYFVYLCSLSFLLIELLQRFVDFVPPFKELALDFIDFFFLLFSKSLCIFSLILIISLLLLPLGFVCSFFSNSFKW